MVQKLKYGGMELNINYDVQKCSLHEMWSPVGHKVNESQVSDQNVSLAYG